MVWDADLYSDLLPELGAAASCFEYEYALQDPLLSQIVTTSAQEEECDFADKILVESLGTTMFIRRSALCRASPAADQWGSFAGTAAAGARLCRGASR